MESVLEEARSIRPNAIVHIQCIVSIRTGVPNLNDFGDNIKKVVYTLTAISTETEATQSRFSKIRRQLGLGDRYFRFNVQQGLNTVRLNEYEKVDQIESATERYLGLQEICEIADNFVAARPPNASISSLSTSAQPALSTALRLWFSATTHERSKE